MIALTICLLFVALGVCWRFGCWLGDLTVTALSRRLDRSVRSDFWGGA